MDILQLNYSDLTDPQQIADWEQANMELSNQVYDRYIVQQLGLNTIVKERKIIKNYSHIFLTINPPPSMVLMDFQKTIEKTLSTTKGLKLWIEGYLYVLEQRGEKEEDNGKGFHTHILIKLNGHKKKSHIDRELKNQWKNILDTDNYHIFNIKYIDQEEQLRKQKYMLGRKAESSKHLKQDMDIIWRQNNSLKNYYFVDYIIEHIEECQDPANIQRNQQQDEDTSVKTIMQHPKSKQSYEEH